MSTLFVDNLKPNANTEITIQGQVNIPGHVLQVKVWTIAEIQRSTSGSWAANTVPTIANTYEVENYNFTKVASSSKVVFHASGHVDSSNVGGGSPSVACLFLESPETLLGAGYRHVRNNNDEPFVYAFSGEDTTSGIEKTYKLRCHSSATDMRFSRNGHTGIGNMPYRIIFWEVGQ